MTAQHHGLGRALIVIAAATVFSFAASDAFAQRGGGGGARGGGAPAKPAPPVPRMPDGTPNFSWVDEANKGVWTTGQNRDFAARLVDKAAGIPFQPWAKALYDYRIKTEQKDDPEGFCLSGGGTTATSNRMSQPWEFIHLPQQKRIVRIFEQNSMWQVIHMDGRQHPQIAYDLPTWLGHSVGRWEGDTLVVDTVGFNEGHWLSVNGLPRTSQHHLVERFTRPDYNTLRYEAEIDDPGAYTQAWKVAWNLNWGAGEELNEFFCVENNKYPSLYPPEDAQFFSGTSAAGTRTQGDATTAIQPSLNEGQGHPLKGIWLGDRGTGANRMPVLIEMNWDGKAITGSISPDTDKIAFTRAELNHNNWTVHLEAQSGGTKYVIDGKIENLGALNRSISGTWTQGNQKGDFKITRQ